MSDNPQTGLWTRQAVTSPKIRYHYRIPDSDNGVDFHAQHLPSRHQFFCPMKNTTPPPARQNKLGAPVKFNDTIAKAVRDAVEDGIPLTHAARIAGISFQSLCEYRRIYPEFDEQVKSAVSRGIQSRLDIVKKAMQSKDENLALRAATWWLTHAPSAAEHFSESRRVELTGADGSPLAVGVGIYLPEKQKDGANLTPVISVDTVKEIDEP
jgi:hypothetical protein